MRYCERRKGGRCGGRGFGICEPALRAYRLATHWIVEAKLFAAKKHLSFATAGFTSSPTQERLISAPLNLYQARLRLPFVYSSRRA